MKIYFAAPLFTTAERLFNLALARELESKWNTVMLPQDMCQKHFAKGEPDWPEVYQTCIDGVRAADAVVAILDGPDQDSGTAFEVGFAVGLGKLVIGVRTDIRKTGDFKGCNIMPFRGCREVIHYDGDNISKLAYMINTMLHPFRIPDNNDK